MTHKMRTLLTATLSLLKVYRDLWLMRRDSKENMHYRMLSHCDSTINKSLKMIDMLLVSSRELPKGLRCLASVRYVVALMFRCRIIFLSTVTVSALL